ncbi:KLDC1 protein, partial [Centropus bengalensis]|nr:KLDC1 protein [Centropus bengalensis]
MAAGPAEPFCVAEHRSGHCALVDGTCLYVWGGYVPLIHWEVSLPMAEVGTGLTTCAPCRTMHLMEGELPTSMSGICGASINGKLYIFGGFDDKGYSNRLYYVNLRTKTGTYRWKRVTTCKGQPPTPRDKLSCWVYKDRAAQISSGHNKQNRLTCHFLNSFFFQEGQIYWGWHNDVHVFDTTTQTWSQPAIRVSVVRPVFRCTWDFPALWTLIVLQNLMLGKATGIRSVWLRLHSLMCSFCLFVPPRINISGENPEDRSWHTLTPIGDDRLFLFGGLSSDNVPLSDGWIHNVTTNGWKQLTHLPKSRPRLWHTACLGKEGEVMVFGGSKDDLCFTDRGHCNDLLIFQMQPYSLLRLCLDCIGRNATVLRNQIPCLPPKLLEQVLKKITFWAAVHHRQEKAAEAEMQSQLDT